MTRHWIAASALALGLLGGLDATPAAAQSCKDPWVTQAIRETRGRAPQGSGNSGECNIDRYGAGSWTSYQDLKTRVQKSYICQDPWIGQVIFYTFGRNPNGSGTAGECNIYLYGNGSWNSYMDLAAKVKQSINSLSAANYRFDVQGNILNASSGRMISPAAQVLITASNVVSAGGANLVVEGSGKVVSGGGANVVSAGGANVVSAGGANVVSAGGANVVSAGGANVVSAGGANLIGLAGGSMIAVGQR